jgi:hypothetical protein
MQQDAEGLAIAAASSEAAASFDQAVTSYLAYRADTAQRIERALEADPQFGLDPYRPDRGLGDTGLVLFETAIHVLTASGQDDRGLAHCLKGCLLMI